MRGVLALVALVTLAGCATNRSALQPLPPSAAAPAPVARRSLPSGPLPAETLASRLGLAYRDVDSAHVLLSDDLTRVRIWKDSNQIAVGGEPVRLKDRTRRSGRSVIVPSSMVSYVEAKVVAQRRDFATPAPVVRPRPASFARPVVPLVQVPTKDRAPAAKSSPLAPRPLGGDPSWEPTLASRGWRWIVLHHSDDTSGNLARYDKIHRETNGWDECGYHFVIGNGSLSGDGEVEIGSRWFKQKHGAHCKTHDNCFNDFGIGVCLVGDFETGGRPSRAQMDELVRLCAWLMARYDIPLSSVVGHCDCKPTACPGKHFPWAELRSRLGD